MKCPFCEGTGKCYQQTITYEEVETNRTNKYLTKCFKCNGTGEIEQTNEEWIKSLNTEELANFLNLIVRVGPYENEPKDFWEHVYGGGGDRGEKSIMEWLKEAHHENN